MSLIRGVLLAGKFRTQRELNQMSHSDQRNTLIVELTGRSKQANFQSFDDTTLAGMGAVLVFLRTTGIRSDAALKTMSADDQRNTLIVEINAQTKMGSSLQGLSNLDLVLLGLGNHIGSSLTPATFIRGVLLAGRFRTHHELLTMSADDERNTLIVEMTKHSNQTDYQKFNDFALAGAGAVMVFLRESGIRDDAALKTMSADDQRNTAIVEINAQTQLGQQLQGLISMDLVRTALGVDPVFNVIKPPIRPPVLPYVFSVDKFDVHVQKSDGDHSDSDWLTIIVTIANPVTKSTRTMPPKMHHIGGRIKSGTTLAGPYISDPIDAGESDVVVINYFVVNLGSSDAEDQFAQGVKVTNQVVGVVGPAAGAAVGLFFGDPASGMKIGKAIADGFSAVIDGLSDVFDFLGIHAGPPNCNGEVLQDTLTYQPGELVQAIGEPASREYSASQGESRCGAAPRTKVHFSVFTLSAAAVAGPVA